jgi:micrococcal nuclease
VKLKKRQIRLLISLLIVLLTGAGAMASPELRQTVTTQVQQQNPGLYAVDHDVDGDTIVVLMDGKKETVRFIGVDTPETHKPNTPVQCFGPNAAAFMKDEVTGKSVRLEVDAQSDNRDKYGRLLRYVYLPDGTLLNKSLVANGYGFAMTGFPFTKMQEFTQAGQTAKAQKSGLWNACQVNYGKGYGQTNNL